MKICVITRVTDYSVTMWGCYVRALYQALRKGGEFVKQGPHPLLTGDWQHGKSIVLGECYSELKMSENKGGILFKDCSDCAGRQEGYMM